MAAEDKATTQDKKLIATTQDKDGNTITTTKSKSSIRYDREIGVFLLTGLPYCVWRAGYRKSKNQYAKHKAKKEEKDRHEKGIPHPILDPSFELDAVNRDKLVTMASHNSSSSSLSSASLAEMERELENDVEFQRFMQTQKEAFLSQRKSLGNNDGSVPELPSSLLLSNLPPLPPGYEEALKEYRRSHSVSSRSSDGSLAELDAYGSARVELPNNTAAAMMSKSVPVPSPVGIICELPADMPSIPNRLVELPAAMA